MCGITGILHLNQKPVSFPILKEMTDIIKHRGPDGEGHWIEKNVGLGHRRLAIIDLTEAGHQPMQTENGNLVVSYNGEVYNFKNIKLELEAKGYRFHSDTDSEVVLKAFQEWGRECVGKFNGMFAFAIWNKRKKELFLARDRYGIKPLYYYFKNGIFLFSSEIKSFLKYPKFQVNVNIKALNEYFSFQNIFSDLTLFENVKMLPAGHTMSISEKRKKIEMSKYWDFKFHDIEYFDNENIYLNEIASLFENAVNKQLISDVEIGSYLSGGIDSGSISCLAAENFRNLKTFTCGFDLSSASGLELGFDERRKAEFLSNQYKTEHYEVVLKAGDMERVMPKLIWHLEDLRVGQSYPNYYISRLASKFVKVVLSGAGGDEIFAGYPWRYYRAVVNYDFENYTDKYYRYWLRLIPDSYKPKFYQPDIYPQILNYQTKDVFKKVLENTNHNLRTPEDYINHSLYLETKTFLHGLLTVEDKLSMANSLETRVPFLDNELVDFAMKIPIKYKLKNLKNVIKMNENEPGRKKLKYYRKTNDGKIILRKVLNRYVPNSYAEDVKQGFSAPDASWFKGESIDYIKDLLLNKSANIYEFLKPEKVHNLMNEHFTGKKNRRLLIWSLLSFEWWLKLFMKKEI